MKTKLILECAKNHNGDILKAIRMIDRAASLGADYVKFQAYSLDDLNPDHPNYERNLACHFSIPILKVLKEHADKVGIGFFCSCFSFDVIVPLSTFTDIVKIPSTYCENNHFSNKCLENFNKVFYSNGMTSDDVYRSNIKFHSFYCVSLYPTPIEEAGLEELNIYEGYSDHTKGIDAMVIANLKGVEYVEKHFSIDKDRNPWEASPSEIHTYIAVTDNLQRYLNDGKPEEKIKKAKEFYEDEFRSVKGKK